MSTPPPPLPLRTSVRLVVLHPDGPPHVWTEQGHLPVVDLGDVFQGVGVAEAASGRFGAALTLLRKMDYRKVTVSQYVAASQATTASRDSRERAAVWSLEAVRMPESAVWSDPAGLPPDDRVWAEASLAPAPAARPLWQRPGGWARLLDWLDSELAAQDRLLSGPPEILKNWQISLLLRCPSAQGPVYLKAVPTFFAAEIPVTCWLSRELPGAAPTVLAADTDLGVMLLEHAGDAFPPDEDAAPPTVAQSVDLLRQLARLQRASEALLPALAGPPLCLKDRRPEWLLTRLDDVLHESRFLIGEPEGLTPGEAERVLALRPRTESALRALAGSPIPLTLSHGDMHSGNLVLQPAADGPDRFTFLDWSDASLSHPFLDSSLGYLLPESLWPGALDAYLEAWTDLSPLPELRELYRQARLAGEFYRLLSYFDHIQPGVEDGSEWRTSHLYHLRALLKIADEGQAVEKQAAEEQAAEEQEKAVLTGTEAPEQSGLVV